jgi:hypothetical protein
LAAKTNSLKTSGGLIYALFPVPGKEKEDDVEIIISVEAADSYRFCVDQEQIISPLIITSVEATLPSLDLI